MPFDIDTGYASASGRQSVNEDFCAALLPEASEVAMGCILAIADGVTIGGMGKEAAQTTVTSLVRDYFGTPPAWETREALGRIITAQNRWLYGVNKRRAPALGLTTLTALVLKGTSYTVAHVGDTRAYLLRGGELTQLTQDHVANHPDMQNQLLRSIGAEDHVVVDYIQGELQANDVFILLSDGVHRHVPLLQLQNLSVNVGVQEASQRLLDAALIAGATDNLTAMVAQVGQLQKPDTQLGVLLPGLAGQTPAKATAPVAPVNVLAYATQVAAMAETLRPPVKEVPKPQAHSQPHPADQPAVQNQTRRFLWASVVVNIVLVAWLVLSR